MGGRWEGSRVPHLIASIGAEGHPGKEEESAPGSCKTQKGEEKDAEEAPDHAASASTVGAVTAAGVGCSLLEGPSLSRVDMVGAGSESRGTTPLKIWPLQVP